MVVLTEGYGDTLVGVRLVDAAESRDPIFESETMVSFPDSLTIRIDDDALSLIFIPRR
jgi:hypothetical protein